LLRWCFYEYFGISLLRAAYLGANLAAKIDVNIAHQVVAATALVDAVDKATQNSWWVILGRTSDRQKSSTLKSIELA
jgi:hypothetical protein